MEQLTQEQAVAFYEAGTWNGMSSFQRAAWQLEQDILCMPFDVFHKALQDALGRLVYTHELGLNRLGLIAELNGQARTPTFDEIVALIPPEKRVLIFS